MFVSTTAIQGGFFADKYGKRGTQIKAGMPTYSFGFSIKDIPAVICAGECNIPDGEVFTAPVKNSVNGVIQYNTDSPYDGKIYKNIRLEFKDGKIVNATVCKDGPVFKGNEVVWEN